MANQDAVTKTFVRAVEELRVVRLVYAPDPPGASRVCHPHVVYETPGGKVLVEAYQVDGYSSSRPEPGWRHFDVQQVSEIVVTDDRFSIDPGYDRDSPKRHGRVIARA